MAKIGWIKLHRKIQECEIWDSSDEPFDKRSAWIDLLLLANHEDKRINFDGKWIIVKSGQRITSLRILAMRWNWSVEKVRRFLNYLEQAEMITRESDTRKTLITIVNYAFYQGQCDTDETPTSTPTSTPTRHQRDTNKNIKNDKEIYKDIVEPEYQKIISYLNLSAGTNYKASTDKTKKLIHARMSEGFTYEDFVTVIDKKVANWKNDSKMCKYLRPETLFGTKFEGYLNEQEVKATPKVNAFTDITSSGYNISELERLATSMPIGGG